MINPVLYISGISIAIFLTLMGLGSFLLLAIYKIRRMSIDSALAGYCLFLAETAPWVLMLSAIGLALSCWGIVYVSYLSPEYKWIIRCVIVFLIAVIASCIHIAGILLVSLSAHMLSYGDQLIGQSDSLLPQSKVGLAGMARQVTVPILLKKRRNAQSQEG